MSAEHPAATKHGWRPFYWDDLGDDWFYRVCVTVGLGCFAFVVGVFLLLVVLGLIEDLT